jgi:hypothetical protein
VPWLPRDEQVEFPACRVPVLELRYLGFDPEPPGQADHPRVGINPEHPAACRLELAGSYAGPAADIQDAGTGA